MIYRIFIINLLDVVFILYIYCVNLEDFQSLYKDPRGEMSVGGRGGIVTFPHYNEKKRRIPEPTVHLTSVEMNNTSEIGVDNQKKISLSPHERNVKLFFLLLTI